MIKLLYAANARIPSEKAHPYQIMQMCEALAEAGAQVCLITPRRANRHPHAADPWGYYGVQPNFEAAQVACLDLFPLAEALPEGRLRSALSRVVSLIQSLTYHISLLPVLRRRAAAGELIYSRDAVTLWLFGLLWPALARQTFYEAHTYPASRLGENIRRALIKRIGGWVVLTEALAERFRALGVEPGRLIVAHDGVNLGRFAVAGGRAEWRARLGWPADAYIVGYLGRFYGGLEGMDKGLDTLADAVLDLRADLSREPVLLALVGGPSSYVDELRARLASEGHDPGFILHPGQVPPPEVPGCLRAFDVCVIPSHWNDFFAYYTSPLKLFEYMASGSVLVATDLPSTAEVIRPGVNGLLAPPGDARALAHTIRQARYEPETARRLAAQAQEDVRQYTWIARAQAILALIGTA